MKKSRYTESQIFQILKEAESGVPVQELCRKDNEFTASGPYFLQIRVEFL